MAILATAKEKYRRKMTVEKRGDVWKKMVTDKSDEYCKGVARFLGVATCAPERASAFKAGVDAITAADFNAAVEGKEEKWAARYKEKMAG